MYKIYKNFGVFILNFTMVSKLCFYKYDKTKRCNKNKRYREKI